MSLRKKACSRCVAAKRRCDRGLPACRRCTRQSLTCEYPGRSVDGPLHSFGLDNPDFPLDMSTAASTGIAMPDMTSCSRPPEWQEMLSLQNDSLSLATFDLSTDALGTFEDMRGLEDPFSAIENMGSSLNIPPGETEFDSQHADSTPDETHEAPDTQSHPTSQTPSTASRLLDYYTSGSPRQPPGTEYVPDISRLSCVTQMWSRGQDLPRWEFCASEALSFVHLFSRTGSAPFLVPKKASIDGTTQSMPLPLLRAMGVCASYTTADETGRPVFEQLLEMETDTLIESSNSEYFGLDSTTSQLDEFRAELARVQAMTMYHVISLFGPSRRMRLRAEKQEALVTSWTRQLLLRLQNLERESSLAPSSTPSSRFSSSLHSGRPAAMEHTQPAPSTVHPPCLREEEIVSAYQTILMSHLVRTIYTSLKYQICRNLPELRSVPILTSSLGKKKSSYDGLVGPPMPPDTLGSGERRPLKMAYTDYSDLWKDEELRCLDRRDRFTVLMLAACKGVGFLDLQ